MDGQRFRPARCRIKPAYPADHTHRRELTAHGAHTRARCTPRGAIGTSCAFEETTVAVKPTRSDISLFTRPLRGTRPPWDLPTELSVANRAQRRDPARRSTPTVPPRTPSRCSLPAVAQRARSASERSGCPTRRVRVADMARCRRLADLEYLAFPLRRRGRVA